MAKILKEMEELPVATMEDIAKRLGISKSTVSKALNNATDVSGATRDAVYQAAMEMGYIRAKQSTGKKIALFLVNMACENPNDFGWSIIAGFRQMAQAEGYQVEVVPLTFADRGAVGYDTYMQTKGFLGGLFLGVSLNDPWLSDFRTCKTPTVLYDNQIRTNPHVALLGVDNEEAMLRSVAHLKSLGHRRVGYLGGGLGSYINQVRHMAFFRALRKYELPSSYHLSGHALYINECIDRHLPRLLRDGVTAIVCGNDLLAHSVLIHCLERGLRVPQDVSIVGFDDLPFCQYTLPPLTTIRQDQLQLGKSGFYALRSLMEDIPIGALLLHAELIERMSTGPAPAGNEVAAK